MGCNKSAVTPIGSPAITRPSYTIDEKPHPIDIDLVDEYLSYLGRIIKLPFGGVYQCIFAGIDRQIWVSCSKTDTRSVKPFEVNSGIPKQSTDNRKSPMNHRSSESDNTIFNIGELRRLCINIHKLGSLSLIINPTALPIILKRDNDMRDYNNERFYDYIYRSDPPVCGGEMKDSSEEIKVSSIGGRTKTKSMMSAEGESIINTNRKITELLINNNFKIFRHLNTLISIRERKQLAAWITRRVTFNIEDYGFCSLLAIGFDDCKLFRKISNNYEFIEYIDTHSLSKFTLSESVDDSW